MWNEFKAFIMRGNVIDLSIAVIIGGAFGAVVSGFTEDIMMPLIGMVVGNVDFSDMKLANCLAVLNSLSLRALLIKFSKIKDLLYFLLKFLHFRSSPFSIYPFSR